METSCCDICCDSFNRLGRKKVECHYCHFAACAACVGRYLLSSREDPHCMSPSCKKPWLHAFLSDSMTKAFVSGPLKMHRRAVLYDRERSYLPATQLEIQRDAKVREVNKRIAEVRDAASSSVHRKHLLLRKIWTFGAARRENNLKVAACVAAAAAVAGAANQARLIEALNVDALSDASDQAAAEVEKARAEQTALAADEKATFAEFLTVRKEIARSAEVVYLMRRTIGRIMAGDDEEEDEEDVEDAAAAAGGSGSRSRKRNFVRACPAEGCKGLLSAAWKCGVCNVRVCRECHEVKGTGDVEDDREGEGHKCKPECVETAKLLAKDTKPCPSCASMIFKIDGCSQVWCTSCRTAFDWNTGSIVTGAGRIHNPHYYEWLRSQSANGEIPREQGDEGCGGPQNVGIHDLRRRLAGFNPIDLDVHLMYSLHRAVQHTHHVEMRRYPQRQAVNEHTNMDVRKRYMLGSVTEDAFKATLQRRDKRAAKDNEMHQVLSTFMQVATEIIKAFVNQRGTPTRADLADALAAASKVRVFANDGMRAIGMRYACVHPSVDAEFNVGHRH